MVAEWSQKFLKKFGMSGICGKTIPHMESKELKKYNIQYLQSRWNRQNRLQQSHNPA